MNRGQKMSKTITWFAASTIAILVFCVPRMAQGNGLIIVDKAMPRHILPPHPPHPPWPPRPIPPHRPIRQFLPLELRSQHVEVAIKDQVAVTKLHQVFYNPSDRRLEGTFIFPVPKGARIDKFSMEVNGKMQKAELLDAKKARKIYEDIVRKALDPALFEYAGQSLFKVRIFPIEPKKEKEVKIKYTEILSRDGKMVRYLYHLNTKKYSSRPIKDLSMKIEVETSGAEIKSVYSPSHEAEVKRHGKQRVVVGLEKKNMATDADFLLYYSLKGKDGGDVDLSVLTHNPEDSDDGGHFMLLVSPGAWKKEEAAIPKDVVFVFDSSGSMRGKKIEQAKEAMKFCVDSLNDEDRFEIIRFSTEAEPVFGKMVAAAAKNRKKASKFIDSVRAIGGTAIEEALGEAATIVSAKASKSRPTQVIFMTDGQPTIGAIKEDVILNSLKKKIGDSKSKVRVFCFGIGTNVNTHLLDKITEETNAVSQYVLPEEDLEYKVSRFYAKISEPVLADLKLEVVGPERIRNIYPKNLPDLFKGDQIVVLGRYEPGSTKGKVILRGTIRGEKKSFKYDALFPKENDKNQFIPRIWATRRVGYLLDEIRLRGEKKELKEEVARLARKYGIVTPYTSYLIIEDEKHHAVPLARRSLGGFAPGTTAAPIAEESLAIERDAKLSYDSFKLEKSGDDAVRGAASGSALKSASGIADFRAARDIAYSGEGKGSGRLMFENRIIDGKTFHLAGNLWIDDDARDDSDKTIHELKFASKEYFDFLEKHPEVIPWLSLGPDVDVIHQGKVIRCRR
jgi:Ca-activated chloride channel family protein